jgi:hypothetical protein
MCADKGSAAEYVQLICFHRLIDPSKAQHALHIKIIGVFFIRRIGGLLGESAFEQMRIAGLEIQAAVDVPARSQFELLADKVIGSARNIAQIGRGPTILVFREPLGQAAHRFAARR